MKMALAQGFQHIVAVSDSKFVGAGSPFFLQIFCIENANPLRNCQVASRQDDLEALIPDRPTNTPNVGVVWCKRPELENFFTQRREPEAVYA
ncbi:MAG: hypothetical protein OXP73_10090 [Chloroflexota bacterium]|nr:hypothetical protein [Chloroflexota bacterium]